jgi:hypothetical protein
MGEPSDVPDRSELVAALTPDARPAAVLRWLQQGHQHFLAGQSLHPHSTRERLQSVVEGQHPLATAVLGNYIACIGHMDDEREGIGPEVIRAQHSSGRIHSHDHRLAVLHPRQLGLGPGDGRVVGADLQERSGI